MVNEEEKIRLIHEYRSVLLDRMFDELSRKAPDGSSEHVSNEIVAVAIRIQTALGVLRHPDASSTIEDLTQPRFFPVVPGREVTDAKRILIASGKVGHDLKAERRKRKDSNTAILFLDQLYPLPRPEISAAFAAHPNAREVVRVQEEPRNMGPFFYVMPRLTQLAQERGLVLGVAFGQAVLERQPRNGFGESARTRTENSGVAGLHHQLRQLIHPTTAWNLKNAFTESGAARVGPWIEFCSAVRNVG